MPTQRFRLIIPGVFFILLFSSCSKGLDILHEIFKDSPASGKLPVSAGQQNTSVIFTNNLGTAVFNGGYGSAMAVISASGYKNNRLFYFMTDRGPNVDAFGGKLFPVPNFNPQIGVFELKGDSLHKLTTIHFKDQLGNLISGRPNPAGQGSTGEIPYDALGNILPLDPSGLDPEGLAITSDGSFWVSDEYGPHLVHFTADGRSIERINPFGSGVGGRRIPKVFSTRRANRGMEGLTITPDQQWLVGMMQSPLENPSTPLSLRNQIRTSGVLRILFFNINSGATKQFIYKTERVNNLVSEIASISNTEFLVLERDGEFPLMGNALSSFKRVFRININGASNISDPADSDGGLVINNKTLEHAAVTNEPGFAALIPVNKSLAVDLIAAFPDYPHDKPEGIALIGKDMLAICNDDDFGIVDNLSGDFMSKLLPFYNPAKVIDHGVTYFVKIK
ncbi:MAG: esterase-like activity of phytase family protein [Chitinophagaceae bacterium]